MLVFADVFANSFAMFDLTSLLYLFDTDGERTDCIAA